MNTCFHVALEPIEGRYSAQWLRCMRTEFHNFVGRNSDWAMLDVLGKQITNEVSAGGFLDFVDTNIWKSSQVMNIAALFKAKFVKPGNVFLFTDAWNPGILQVKYMSEMTGIPVRIVSIWHAGSYDKWDMLGYVIKDKKWSLAAERSYFHASDVNVFATKFHRNFFIKNCLLEKDDLPPHTLTRIEMEHLLKCVVSGQPHYEILKWFDEHPNKGPKKDIILFPHRICQEKRPEIFTELKRLLPEYLCLRTQDLNLSKHDYYTLLSMAKIVFSASEHEMLGISQMEGLLAGAFPLMPDRLSYHEIYDPIYLYPGGWTMPGHVNYDGLVDRIKAIMKGAYFRPPHEIQMQTLKSNYLTCAPMWEAIIGVNNE